MAPKRGTKPMPKIRKAPVKKPKVKPSGPPAMPMMPGAGRGGFTKFS